ncbi:hypothetical protein TNIN_196931 [Trichonephila inaurata madagascariensis]|uniref:Uncharacterized protein n=1 Tax=Trichonephila inaurata madagascariensis TaxID=2747483 RepID=A0A8X6XIQ0_9ARAC|nr:hypothetical protein TNIN_196931 [Trichonephila inaurata madagascariensis]
MIWTTSLNEGGEEHYSGTSLRGMFCILFLAPAPLLRGIFKGETHRGATKIDEETFGLFPFLGKFFPKKKRKKRFVPICPADMFDDGRRKKEHRIIGRWISAFILPQIPSLPHPLLHSRFSFFSSASKMRTFAEINVLLFLVRLKSNLEVKGYYTSGFNAHFSEGCVE